MKSFIHLHVHSEYSLLDSTLKIDDLLKQARAHQMPAVALTDHGSILGAVNFYKKAKQSEVKPIIGAELYLAPGSRFDRPNRREDELNYHHLRYFRAIAHERSLTRAAALLHVSQSALSAQIKQLQPLEQGRFELSAVGLERFRIQALKEDQPYMVGVVEEFPLRMDDTPAILKAEGRLRPWLERYVRSLTQDEHVEAAIENFPDDPLGLAYLAAVVVQVPPLQKQSLLELERCADLLEQLRPLYRREVALVEAIIRSQPSDLTLPFSKN